MTDRQPLPQLDERVIECLVFLLTRQAKKEPRPGEAGAGGATYVKRSPPIGL